MRHIRTALVSLILCAALALPTLAEEASPFFDANDIQHQEAVSALVKLGIIQGFSDGGFHPKDTISRAQAAKFLAQIMNGGRDFEDFSTSEPSFSDTHGHWAEAYIEYCADLGIISGCGDGTFAPEGKITGIALAKMALGTLGYDPEAYRLTGPQWSVRTDELARSMDPGLYSGLSGVDLNQPISRDDAAQILYNALLAVPRMVKPVPQPDGTVEWQFMPATQADGTASSLLWERFAVRPEDLTSD